MVGLVPSAWQLFCSHCSLSSLFFVVAVVRRVCGWLCSVSVAVVLLSLFFVVAVVRSVSVVLLSSFFVVCSDSQSWWLGGKVVFRDRALVYQV